MAGGASFALPVVGDLDGDGIPEIVVVFSNFVAQGTSIAAYRGNGSAILWEYEGSFGGGSAPALADLDDDGSPEVVAVCSNNDLFDAESWLCTFSADGVLLWETDVFSGAAFNYASGPVVSDMDHDGSPEIVVGRVIFDADEVVTGSDLYDIDGNVLTHPLANILSVPTIADLDADGHAEILVANGPDTALTVFRDTANAWAPARALWNQHAYSATNIDDDLTVPVTAAPSFTTHNTFRAAPALISGELGAEILGVCEDECAAGTLRVTVRGRNSGGTALDAGVSFALYGTPSGAVVGHGPDHCRHPSAHDNRDGGDLRSHLLTGRRHAAPSDTQRPRWP